MKGKIIVFSGPSGAGKTKLTQELLRRNETMKKKLSVTSRPIREDDIGKNNYVFVTEEEFLKMKEQGKFFETNLYDGSWYGTLSVPVEELSESDLIFDKDVNGALAIKEKYPEAITFYIMAKDNATLLKRRGNRGSNRSQIAIEEVPKAKLLDFLVINDELEVAVSLIEGIIELIRINFLEDRSLEESVLYEFSMKNPKNQEFLDKFYL